MKKGEIYEGKVCYVNFSNKAIIEHEDGKVTVKNALPGQTVSCMINKKNNRRNTSVETYKNCYLQL